MQTPPLSVGGLGGDAQSPEGDRESIIVLTDGYTPWPADPPPGSRVIVGLLIDGSGSGAIELAGPDSARTIVIDEP